MANLKYVNKASGKEFSGTPKQIEKIKSNPLIADLYTFEAEVPKPSEVSTKKESVAPAETGDDKKSKN